MDLWWRVGSSRENHDWKLLLLAEVFSMRAWHYGYVALQKISADVIVYILLGGLLGLIQPSTLFPAACLKTRSFVIRLWLLDLMSISFGSSPSL